MHPYQNGANKFNGTHTTPTANNALTVTVTEPAALEPILLRVEEAARLLSLGRTTVYLLMESGELPSIKCGSARRIPRAALEAWVAQRVADGG